MLEGGALAFIAAMPWEAAATSSRAFTSTGNANFVANRLWEYNNTGPGSAP